MLTEKTHFSILLRLTYSVVVTVLVGLAVSSTWAQVNENQKLLPTDGAAGDQFGYSVAIAEGKIAVGARWDDDNGAESGSAYLFDALSGAQLLKLVPDDGIAGAEFGFSIAIGGGVVAVGAVSDHDAGINSGSAYLFDAITGAQIAKLLPSDGADGDQFGFAVALAGGVVAVGAKRDDDNGQDSGSVYLFDVSTGAQTGKLLPSDGAANNTFGEAVGLDGDILVVGAHGAWFDARPAAGAAYLFDVSTGDQLDKLVASNAASWDFFGSAADIDDGTVAVGAWARNIFFDHSGAAYLFDAASGSETHYVVPADGHDRDHFGISIAIDSGVVAIGADGDDDTAFDAGSAYLFDAISGNRKAKLLASDGASFDDFGASIAIGIDLVVVGASRDDDNGTDSGSVYLFDATSGASCSTASDCDDGLFCNGAERCVNQSCRLGTPPCTANMLCDENSDECFGCTPGTAEINDALDNQDCPDDPGAGLIDEISGTSGFFDPLDSSLLSWTAQEGALEFAVARSDTPDMQQQCRLDRTPAASFSDFSIPDPGSAYFYVIRATQQHAGSWGVDSRRVERHPKCE